MSDSAFWHELAEQFQSEDPAGAFGYQWQKTTAGDGFKPFRASPPPPTFRPDDNKALRLRFERLAVEAGHKLDASGTKDPRQVWLEELLRKHLEDPRNNKDWAGPETLPDGTNVWYQAGFMPEVFHLSTDLCIEFEIQSRMSEGRSQHQVHSPTTGRSDIKHLVGSTGLEKEIGTAAGRLGAPDTPALTVAAASGRRRRGRKSHFTQAQLDEARSMKQAGKHNNEIAKLLYDTLTPSAAQRRSVPTILNHHFKSKK